MKMVEAAVAAGWLIGRDFTGPGRRPSTILLAMDLPQLLARIALVLGAVAGMEAAAWWIHKHVMHGWGWGWHRSHHAPRTGWFERNDLYAVVFASVAIALIAAGSRWRAVVECSRSRSSASGSSRSRSV